jgi:WD40 repeat protein
MRSSHFRSFLVLVLLGFVAACQAQLAPNMTIESLDWPASQASLVVRGTVTAEERTKGDPQPWVSLATITFKVEETLKGSAQKTLRFVAPSSQQYKPTPIWKPIGKPLLAFLSPSRFRFDRLKSRYEYVLDSAIELDDKAKATTADNESLSGADAILKYLRKALPKLTGPYYVAKFKPVANGYKLRLPELAATRSTWGNDPPVRFTNNAVYDGRRIIAARGNLACVWDAVSGERLHSLKGSDDQVQAVALAPDGDRLLVSSGTRQIAADYSIRLWNLGSGKFDKILGTPRTAAFRVEFVPYANRVFSVCYDYGTTRYLQTEWNEFSGEWVFVYPGNGAKYSLDTSMVLSGDFGDFFDSTDWVAVWDTQTYLQLCTIQAKDEGSRFHTADFSPFGNRVVTAGNKGIEVWDAETGKKLFRAPTMAARAVAYSHDGRFIVASVDDRFIFVLDGSTGKELRRMKNAMQPYEVLVSPDSKTVFTKWGNPPAFQRRSGASLWDLETGKEIIGFARSPDGLVGFSPDGKTVCEVNVERTQATIWSTESGKALRTIALK